MADLGSYRRLLTAGGYIRQVEVIPLVLHKAFFGEVSDNHVLLERWHITQPLAQVVLYVRIRHQEQGCLLPLALS